MLEIRNITKVYRSKTGEEVKALDNVSIQFPENGMVFILGKSGSGKSTLLNVMGGLDSYDRGEFVIKGKSSREFAGSDFDAYRNTFIGFIFQEYNVLDDFTVGANIALALELQGKKATDEAVNGILAQVDLLNYAKRKPNELSGGQKQRVAIARALVKEPEIIMADEPTGALDSNTGKQIFDTLKELSKTKLVLIVSHDRDFAERYADRIVELADGKIIEDVTKHEHKAEQISEGVHRINDNILRIESGYRLTAKDLEMINAYLAQSKNDVLLSGDGRVNDELRSAAGISKDGATTVFEGTDPERDVKTKKYEKGDSKFIRSRLPMKNAVKMGASGLKHKKFRLFMTVLLSFISFAMFGLSSTVAAYKQIAGATASMMDSNVRNASITASVRYTNIYFDRDDVSHWYNIAGINEDDIAKLNAETGLNFVPVYTGGGAWGNGFSMTQQMESYQNNQVYTGKFSGIVALTKADFDMTGYSLIGDWPAADDEIVITELMYRQFKEFGFKNTDTEEAVEAGALTKDDGTNGILGKHIAFDGFDTKEGVYKKLQLKIVGIADTEFDYDRYASFLPKDESDGSQMPDDNSLLDMVLANELEYEIDYGFHALIFASEATVNTIASSSSMQYVEIGRYMNAANHELSLVLERDSGEDGDKGMHFERTFARVVKFADASALGTIDWLDGRENGVLGEKEILISADNKDMLQLSEADVTLSEAQVAALAAIYGEDAWNAADPENNAVSFEQRMQRAAVIAYIRNALTTVSGLQAYIEADATSNGYSMPAYEYWMMKWDEHGGNFNENYPLDFGGNVDSYYTVRDSWRERAEIKAFVEQFLGVEFPASVEPNRIGNLAYEILSKYYGGDLTHKFSDTDFYWTLRDIYMTPEMEALAPWSNEKLVELLIEREHQEIDSRTAWDAKSPEEQKSIMHDFYMYYYADGVEFEEYYTQPGYIDPTYTSADIYEMSRGALMHASGTTQEDLLDQFVIKLRERNYQTNNDVDLSGFEEYTVAGFFSNTQQSQAFVSDSIYAYVESWIEQKEAESEFKPTSKTERAEHEDGIWGFVIAPMPKDEAVIAKLAAMHYAEEGYGLDVKFSMNNAVMATLGQFDDIIEIIAEVFVWLGLGLAVFSSFLLMNFISTSISYKKREIGILRAVGARSSDVFKIFFSEAFIIAFINFVLATAASLTTVIILNNYMRNSGINITLLNFGLLQIALMLGVSMLVAVLASFLPVYRIARKKPVDAIKDR